MVDNRITVLYSDNEISVRYEAKAVIAVFIGSYIIDFIAVQVIDRRAVFVCDRYCDIRNRSFVFVDGSIAVFIEPDFTGYTMLNVEAKVDVLEFQC